MAHLLRFDGGLDAALFEMITLIVARQWSAQYVWVVHAREAETTGLDAAIIEAIRARRTPPFTNERQAVIYEMTHELVETKQLSDATYARALATFGVDLVLEIVTAVGFYTLVSMTLKTFDAPAPGDARPLD
jgi:4-carboxymuconolactone decarboxylase